LLAASVAFALHLSATPGSPHAFSLIGSFHYPNGLAGFLMLTIYPSFALFLHAGTARRAWTFGFFSTVLLLALLLTRSRGGWLVFLLVVLVWAVQERALLVRQWKRVAVVGFLLAAFAWVMTGGGLSAYLQHGASLASVAISPASNASFSYRRHIYAWAFQIFLDHLWLGTGPGTFPLMLGRYQEIPYVSGLYAHNHYLQVASEMGLVGVFLLFSLLAWLFVRGVRVVRELSPLSLERSLAVSLLCALLASALHAGIDFDWSYPAIAFGVVLQAALLMSYHRPQIANPRPLWIGAGWIRLLAVVFLCSMVLLALARFYAETSVRSGKWALKEGFLSQAGQAFRRASFLNPFSYASHYWLSAILADQGRRTEAVREAEAALRLNPEDGNAYNHLGNIYWRTGRLEEAKQALTRAVKVEPFAHLKFYGDLGAFLLAKGQNAEAHRVYRKAVQVFTPEQVLGRTARCLAPGDRYLLAGIVEWLSRASELEPEASRREWNHLAAKLRESDLRGICRRGLRAGFTSPEATILTHWEAIREGSLDLLLATYSNDARKRLDSPVSLPGWVREASVARIVAMSASEIEAWVVYELEAGDRRLRLRDRLKLENDGWRLVQLRK
ncbi:MAG: O-antigen ligase family protein, partial [Candidatus Methylomirabilales bacterium]